MEVSRVEVSRVVEVEVEVEVGKPNKRKPKQKQKPAMEPERNGTPRLLRIALIYNLAS